MKRILLLLLLGFSTVFYAQNNVLTSGKDVTSASWKVTYSVGLIHYKDASGTGGTSSTGSQIAFEVLETLSLDEHNLVSLRIFPNPTSDYITINLTQQELLSYKLIDVSGREITKGKITTLQTKIDLNNLNTSIYILNIYQNSQTFKSYKIIKK